jgi:hypothetical protein
MNKTSKRSCAALGVSLLVAISAPAMSVMSKAAAAPVAIPQTQKVVGGGIGTESVIARFASYWDGHYTTPGQLGSGTYRFGGFEQAITLTRSDGMTMTGTITQVPFPYDCGPYDVQVDCIHAELVGTADIAAAHLQISVTTQGPVVNQSVKSALLMRGALTLRHRTGYVMVDATGNTYAFGGVDGLGGLPTFGETDVELTPSGKGYWIVNGAGRVAGFGDAHFGNNALLFRAGERVTSMSSTPSGGGYWLFTNRGRVLPFGDAEVFGDLGSVTLNGPIVGSVATPTGKGYYMVGGDGGVFAFGDAHFRGSMGGVRLNQPVVGIVPNATNDGYWLAAADGGIFAFDAPYLGSMGSVRLNRPVVGVVRYGKGYLLVARDGGIFNFSSAPFFGSTGGRAVPPDIVSAAAIG